MTSLKPPEASVTSLRGKKIDQILENHHGVELENGMSRSLTLTAALRTAAEVIAFYAEQVPVLSSSGTDFKWYDFGELAKEFLKENWEG